MALSISRSFACQAGKIVQKSSRFSTCKPSPVLQVEGKFGQISRAITRSMWYMCNTHGDGTVISDSVVSHVSKNVRWPSKACTCGSQAACLHTKADKHLADFLTQEIELEKESKKHPQHPAIAGFEFSCNGAMGHLTKTNGDEIIKVTFNVNHSVEFEETGDAGKSSQVGDEEVPDDGKMVSYPDFTVEITKGNQPTVAIQCSYTTDEFDAESGEMEPTSGDLFLIDEMFIYEGKPDDVTYRVGSEVMQGEMYDSVFAMLSSRGIDNKFSEQLADLASSLEHTNYIQFLETLKKILS